MGDTAIQPTMGHMHRPLCVIVITWIRGTLIKGHDNIRSNNTLDFHHIFWSKNVIRTVDVRFKLHTFLLDFSVIRQGIYLITSTVSENILIPIHKLVKSTSLFDNLRL